MLVHVRWRGLCCARSCRSLPMIISLVGRCWSWRNPRQGVAEMESLVICCFDACFVFLLLYLACWIKRGVLTATMIAPRGAWMGGLLLL